jgi:transcriptional regulator with XRE-family HTH domain
MFSGSVTISAYMTSSLNLNTKSAAAHLGTLLRHWRGTRGRSQIDLSLDSGISQKHISQVESGRSVPSRQILMDLAQALDVPLRERNTLLLAAGYAPMYPEGAWDAAEMQSINRVLERMLRQHEPFPALVMDRYWNVVMTNTSAPAFFNRFIDMSARPKPRNMLHLIFDPQGMRPFVADWPAVAQSLMQRVYRESVGRVVDEKTRELLQALLAYPDVKPQWQAPVQGATSTLPIIPLSFVKDGKIMNYFSMVSTVGTPVAVAAQELRVECMFPADEATEREHMALMAA